QASARFYPRGEIVDTAAALTERVLASLDRSVAHLACHGLVRHDNPMFSSLRLTDGPLPIHALQAAPALPDTVVLSACDVGRPGNAGPAHVLGLPAALLSMGVRAVVASPIAVPDRATAAVMIEFHRRLATGIEPAEALARLRVGPPATAEAGEAGRPEHDSEHDAGPGLDPEALMVLASVFTCHGG
ncbi:MAG: CHAT domain-containing protein, partial [Acidimicrobiales bacterium]